MSDGTPLHRPPADGEYYVFRDPVHNLIEIEDEVEGRFVRALLRTREMQRLRFLSQNGLGRFVYSGLETSRFPHSLGVYHIAKRIIFSLMDRQPRGDVGFPHALRIGSRDCRAFPIAALLHDIGHGPLSHLWEEILPAQFNHEQMGSRLLRSQETELGGFLSSINPQDFPGYENIGEDVLAFLEGTHRLYYLRQLLSGNLDVDRLDFMSRDTKNAGVTYGFHDLDWIVRSFRFARITHEAVEGQNLTEFAPFWSIAIDARKGTSALVQFLRARENMYSLVYLHKTIRSASSMLKKILWRARDLLLRDDKSVFCDRFLTSALLSREYDEKIHARLDDNVIWYHVNTWTDSEDPILSSLCKRILRRQLFKVFSLEGEVYERLRKIDEEYGNHVAAIVAARKSISQEDAKYYYEFDTDTFNKVGRTPRSLSDTVWLIKDGPLGHLYQTLQDYWLSVDSSMDQKFHYIVVDDDCVQSIINLVNRLRFTVKSSAVAEDLTPPDNYRILCPLGAEGVWKSVYVGVETTPGGEYSICALKAYKRTETIADALDRDVKKVNMLAEAKDNLSISRILNSEDGKIWLAEPLWKCSLFDYMTRVGAIKDIVELLEIGVDLFRGLSALHEVELRHTDIKPENCGIIQVGRIRQRFVIGDFGCISSKPNDPPLDLHLLGTQRTRAPEVFLDAQHIGLAADVWAVGATLYALCRHRYPFMELSTPHGTEEQRRDRERSIREGMPAKLAEFRDDARLAMAPALWSTLEPAFADKPSRATAQTMLMRFEDALREVRREFPEGRDKMVRHVWKRADDVVEQMKRPKALASEIAEDVKEIKERFQNYVPPIIFNQFS